MTTRNEMEALLDAIQGGGKVVGEPAMSTVMAIRAAITERDELKAENTLLKEKIAALHWKIVDHKTCKAELVRRAREKVVSQPNAIIQNVEAVLLARDLAAEKVEP